jgi:hypothetical protein
VIPIHSANTAKVIGIVNAQYTQNLSLTTLPPVHCNDGTAKRAAKNVAGRNTIVMTAIVFIEELSSTASLASLMFLSASSLASLASLMFAVASF